MKKLALFSAIAFLASSLISCGGAATEEATADTTAVEEVVVEEVVADTTATVDSTVVAQ